MYWIMGVIAVALGATITLVISEINKKISKNTTAIVSNNDEIKTVNDNMSDNYVKKEDFREFKTEHSAEHQRQREDHNELNKKLDRIIQLLLEEKNEK